MTWFAFYPEIKNLLNSHFPSSSDEEQEYWISEIYNSWTAVKALETIERSDRPATNDIQSLAKIENLLRKAVAEFELVGWHGCKALQDGATDLLNTHDDPHWPIQSQLLGSETVFSNRLEELAAKVALAKSQIPEDAQSINSAFGEGLGFKRTNSKPTKTTAEHVAIECAYAFEALTDQKAAVRTSSSDGRAYGPFLDFVNDTFRTLDISASAETWARNARKKPNKI